MNVRTLVLLCLSVALTRSAITPLGRTTASVPLGTPGTARTALVGKNEENASQFPFYCSRNYDWLNCARPHAGNDVKGEGISD